MLDQRHEFCALATSPGVNLAELSRRYNVSRKTAYKWISRFKAGGQQALADRSRRPLTSPGQIQPQMEEQIVQLRREHPFWAGRKLRRRLQDLGEQAPPAASTIQQVLFRNHLRETPRVFSKPFVRFERPRPNDLWQMDYKGHFPLGCGRRCHPLTVLDDHSRFCLTLCGCENEQAETVKAVLQQLFERYGLPEAMLCDNGSPWGNSGAAWDDDADSPHTLLTVWLLRLGVAVSHGRPLHPQTQGKVERLHRTMDVELIASRRFEELASFQRHAEQWRETYNCIRPHEALELATPASRYTPSVRKYPAVLPAVEYDSCDEVRKVDKYGHISFRNRRWVIGKAFVGQNVAIRPGDGDGTMNVFFSRLQIKQLDLRAGGE